MTSPRHASSIAVFNPDGKLLMGRRLDNDKYTLPGGHKEDDETPAECAEREMYEEAGLRVRHLGFLGAGRLQTHKGRDYVISSFRCVSHDTPNSDNDPDNEVETWEWIDVDSEKFQDILKNLHSPKNVTLVMLGLQDDDSFFEDTVIDPDVGTTSDLDINDLQKAIASVSPGAPISHPSLMVTQTHAAVPHTTHDFSHVLPIPSRSKYKLLIQQRSFPGTKNHSLTAHVLDHDGKTHGSVSANILFSGTKLKIGNANLHPKLRGQGVGTAAYEALMAHAYHSHGTKVMAGDDHSSMAHAVHERLASKHGLDYKPTLSVHSPSEAADIKHSLETSADPDRAKGPYDSKYASYEYAIKSAIDSSSEALLKHDATMSPEEFTTRFYGSDRNNRDDLVKHPGITKAHWQHLLAHEESVSPSGRANAFMHAREHPEGWEPMVDVMSPSTIGIDVANMDWQYSSQDHSKAHYLLDKLKEKDPDLYHERLDRSFTSRVPLAERHVADVNPRNLAIFENPHVDQTHLNSRWENLSDQVRSDLIRNPAARTTDAHWREIAKNPLVQIHNIAHKAPSSKELFQAFEDRNLGADEYLHGDVWPRLFKDKSLTHQQLQPHLDKMNSHEVTELLRHHAAAFPKESVGHLLSKHPVLVNDSYLHDSLYEGGHIPGNEVGIRLGTSKLRDLRQTLTEAPNGRLHNTELKAKGVDLGQMGLNKLLDNHGFVSANDVSKHIDSTPAKTYNWSEGEVWKGQQRHSKSPSTVWQMNATPKMLEQIRSDPEVHETYKDLLSSVHPHHKSRGIGWVRSTARPDGIHIDEIQSDFGQNTNHKMKAGKIHGDETVLKRLQQILFDGHHPSELLHEGFHQHLRDRGDAGKQIHMWTPPSKAKLAGQDLSRDLPGHMLDTYSKQPKKMGYKPSSYGAISTQENDKLKGEPTQARILTKSQQLMLDALVEALQKTQHEDATGGVVKPKFDLERYKHQLTSEYVDANDALKEQNIGSLGELPHSDLKDVLKHTKFGLINDSDLEDHTRGVTSQDWGDIFNHKLESAVSGHEFADVFRAAKGKINEPEGIAAVHRHINHIKNSPLSQNTQSAFIDRAANTVAGNATHSPAQHEYLAQNPDVLGLSHPGVIAGLPQAHANKLLNSNAFDMVDRYQRGTILRHVNAQENGADIKKALVHPRTPAGAFSDVADRLETVGHGFKDHEILDLLHKPLMQDHGRSLLTNERMSRLQDHVSADDLNNHILAAGTHDHLTPMNFVRGYLNDSTSIHQAGKKLPAWQQMHDGVADEPMLQYKLKQHHAAAFWNGYEQEVQPHHFAVGEKLRSNSQDHVEVTDHRGKTGNSQHWGPIDSALQQHAGAVQEEILNDKHLPKKMINGEMHIPVYRGVAGDYAKQLHDAKESGATHVEVPNAAFSSWSTDPDVAHGFASRHIAGHSRHSALMRRWAPVSQVLHSGFHQAFENQHHHHQEESEIVFQHPESHIKIPVEDISTKNRMYDVGSHHQMLDQHDEWAHNKKTPAGSFPPAGDEVYDHI